MKYLNDKYTNEVIFLKLMSDSFGKELGIEIDVFISNIDKLNAEVSHISDNRYQIIIYSQCLNLNYQIEKITKRYTEDDLQFFWRVKHLGIFERFGDDTYREELNNLFSTIILAQIFYHECGHIEARHIGEKEERYEEYDSERSGSYELQEHEMVADWLSSKRLFKVLFFSVVKYNVLNESEILAVMKQLAVLYWISLTIEFQIFDSNHMKKVDDFSILTHPHPAVRLFYSIDAMREAMMDIFNIYGLDDDRAEESTNCIINEMYIYIKSFLMITDTPINKLISDKKIFKYYIILRDIPYMKEDDGCVHLMPLPDEYRQFYFRYNPMCCSSC